MDAGALVNIYKYLGERRMGALCDEAALSADALRLYSWELSVRQALIKPLTITEVVVRNAIDMALSAWWEGEGYAGTWTDPAVEDTLLAPFADVKRWKKRAQIDAWDESKALTHDDLISHASFGTWRNMIGNPLSIASSKPIESDAERMQSWEAARLQDSRCGDLWRVATKEAFPGIPKTKSERDKLSPRAYIGSRLSRISALRNRVCHCDNLTRANIAGRYKDMKDIAAAIHEDAAGWLQSQCDGEIEDIVSKKPVL